MSLQRQLPCSSDPIPPVTTAAAIPISVIPAAPTASAATTGMREEGKKRRSRGRQRIEMAPIQDKPKRHVTFKKRRDGLFKKASELCVLCGANVAILTFSGAGKPFCFGFPSVDAVVSNFLQGRPSFNPTSSNINDYAPMLHKYNSEYELIKQKMKRSSDDGSDRENNGGFWRDRSMDGLEINELDQYSKSLEELRDNVVTKVKQMESNLVAVHNEPQMTSSMGDDVTRDHDAVKDIVVHHDMMKDDCIKS